MTPPPGYAGEPAGRPPSGLLLVRGGAEVALAWAEGGLTAVRVVALPDGWTAVVPVSATSAAPPPYDDSVSVLLARPVPHRMRPALGVAVVGDQALVAATPARWRAVQRWVAWQAGTGLVRPGGLPTARLVDLVHLAGAAGVAGPADAAGSARTDSPGALAALTAIVHDPSGDARSVLRDVLAAIGLPGGDLLGPDPHGAPRRPSGISAGGNSPAAGTHVVEPSSSRVAAFTRMVTEDAAWREETGERL